MARITLPRTLGLLAAAVGALAAGDAPGGPKEDLKALRGRIEAVQKQLQAAEESKTEVVDALRESERAISDARRALRELAAESRAADSRLVELKRTSRSLETDIARRQERLGRLLYERYRAGEPEALRLLLNAESPEKTARQLHYLTYLTRAQAAAVNNLRAGLAELAGVTRQTREQMAELAALQEQRREEQARLERESRARREVLTKLSREIETNRKQISTMKRDEARLTRLIESLARALATPAPRKRTGPAERNERLPDASADGSPFAALKGRLALPVRGELRSRFGSPRTEGGPPWKGVFIAAGAGQDVKAIAGGRVVYADWLRGFGNLLILDHGGGYMSLYGNNETLYRQAGENVGAGETVAAVGATGGNPDSGLYFELRHQGKPFDPLTWVQLK